jgi:5-methylthioribose kinase
VTTAFALAADSVVPYLVERGLLAVGDGAEVEELGGGVSGMVLAVRAPGVRVVAKQALPRLKVEDDWRSKLERTEIEAAALRLCDRLTPGRVPAVLDLDPDAHVVVMELLPDDARNWQAEIGEGRTHTVAAGWAGETLGLWHSRTAGDAEVAAAFVDHEPFEELRLNPFYEVVAERLPAAAPLVLPRLAELRERRCLVDGDYAMKNMLIAPGRRWKLDFEVAHYGNPVFDLGFFLSFALLSALRWPELTADMRAVADAFLARYDELADRGDDAYVTAHTGCLVLARTDGKSPAAFLDPPSVERARVAALALLRTPEEGLWQWI